MPNTKPAFSWSLDKIAFGVLALISLEPALSAILGRLAKGGWWFGDFDALLCGATTIAAGHSPYSLTPVCSGLHPARFVYAPQIGYAVAPVVQALGPDGARLAGMALLIPFTLLILWYAVLKPTPRVPMTMKLFALMAVRGSPLASGNVGAILHGLIIAATLKLKTYRWLFILVVIGCALVKPFFLAALIVLLFEARPLKARLMTFVPAFVLGITALAALILTSGAYGAQWQEALHTTVFQAQPGRGFLACIWYLGLRPDTPLVVLAYGLFASLMVGAGLVLAETAKLCDNERVLLALGLVQLINPRLYEYNYDMYLLYPAMALVVMIAKDLDARVFAWLRGLFIAVMICDFLISLIGINILPYFPGTFLTLCVLFLTVTVLSLKRENLFLRLSGATDSRRAGVLSQSQPPQANRRLEEK